MKKRILAVLTAFVMLLPLCLGVSARENGDVTVLFTHDLHSHFLPCASEDGGEFGGFARLMTAINQQKEKYPDAILVDGGDFSMGSLFQTAYAASALELRLMGAMGYDVTTFGNHEFDYLPQGLVSMLNAAVASGDALPAIVDANYLPPTQPGADYRFDAEATWAALNSYGVRDYIILERGGVHFVIFGLTGYDSHDCAPNSGMILEEPAAAAQRVVDAATAECMEKYGAEPAVIALSHSGTKGGQGEDYELAQAVKGIHVIISGHTHTTLAEPIQVGSTYICSAGEYGQYLGVVGLDSDSGQLTRYELIPIDENVEEDPAIAALVESCKADVEINYLFNYGMGFDEVLVDNPYTFDSVDDVYGYAHESTLGSVFADAYKWAAEETLGERVDLALTAAGVIRETIPVGAVTVSDVFNAASLGVGTEGELIAIYLTGEDLKNVLEVDASVYPLMHSAQLFCSGVEYSFNTSRMIFNKVDYAMLRRSDGTVEQIDDDEMYLVVCGMYMGQMLGSVEDTSFGLLSITPRDKDGNPIAAEELVNYVVKEADGTPLKEWYAISSYLQDMDGTMAEQYGQTDGRKVVYSSFNPVKLLRNANMFTYIALALVLILIWVLFLIVRAIVRRVKRKKNASAHNEKT